MRTLLTQCICEYMHISGVDKNVCALLSAYTSYAKKYSITKCAKYNRNIFSQLLES